MGEEEGVVEVCVELGHLPMRTIVSVTVTTEPVSATGVLYVLHTTSS